MSVKTRSVFLSPMAPVLAWYLDHSQHSLRTDQINSLIQEMFWKHQNMSDAVLGQRTLGEQSRARPYSHGASQVALVVKSPLANAGEVRDAGSVSGSGRFPLEEGMATHSSILAWRIPWTEELVGHSP